MILITGGAFQGKKEFALTLVKDGCIVEGDQLNEETIRGADIAADFHLYIRRLLQEGRNAREEAAALLKGQDRLILTVDELGCGIVPIDAFERNYRETTGRISCELAKQAEAVYRVQCGIGVRIK